MNTVVKGFVILLLSLAILALAACSSRDTVTATSAPSAAELPATAVPEPATETAAPPPPTAEIEPSPTLPPVSSPTIVIPTREPTSVPPTATATKVLKAEPEIVAEVQIDPLPRFASYSPMPVDVVPAMYHEAIAPDLSNVLVSFVLSPNQ